MSMTDRRQWLDGKLSAPIEEDIRIYTLDKTEFFKETIGEHDISKYRVAMEQIIARYDIRNKRILCVGPGQCWYEYWFTNDNNQILFVDIDEKGIIEPLLQKLNTNSSNSTDTIHYAICDARNLKAYLSEPFDLILSFGFTPDEYYRAQVQKDLSKNAASHFNWPLHKPTFSDLILNLTKQLPDGGLLVSLSYCGGPNATSPTYLASAKETCDENQLSLLEITAVKESPGVHLVIARKGEQPDETDHKKLPTLTTIHPRGEKDACSLPVFSVHPCDNYTSFDKYEDRAAKIIENNFRSLKSCFYDGIQSSEVRSMLLAKMNVTALASSKSKKNFKIFPNCGDLSFLTVEDLDPKNQFDLIWMSSFKRDDVHRSSAQQFYLQGDFKNSNLAFSEGTHKILEKVRAKYFAVYGSAGIDVTKNFQFIEQLKSELRRHGFHLKKLYVLRDTPSIFFAFANHKNKSSVLDFRVGEFYPNAENSEAIEIQLPAPIIAMGLSRWIQVKKKIKAIVSYLRDFKV